MFFKRTALDIRQRLLQKQINWIGQTFPKRKVPRENEKKKLHLLKQSSAGTIRNTRFNDFVDFKVFCSVSESRFPE